MQRGSRMTSAGFWADPAKTGQLEDLVAQLVQVGMCAMLIVGLVYWAVPGGRTAVNCVGMSSSG